MDENPAEAVEQLTEAAKRGDARAWKRLGYIYRDGIKGIVEKDVAKSNKCMDEAKELWTRAAKNGDADAQYELGFLLWVGLRCQPYEPDYEAIANWYKKAAEQGHLNAQMGLADMYEKGRGVPKNEEKALFWYSKAAEQGNESAKKRVEAATKKGCCYVATCVYGSYDCPQVWTLRRYRDSRLSMSWLGRRFIQVYYAVSPTVVRLFGDKKWFKGLCKPIIDSIVSRLQRSGIYGGPSNP